MILRKIITSLLFIVFFSNVLIAKHGPMVHEKQKQQKVKEYIRAATVVILGVGFPCFVLYACHNNCLEMLAPFLTSEGFKKLKKEKEKYDAVANRCQKDMEQSQKEVERLEKEAQEKLQKMRRDHAVEMERLRKERQEIEEKRKQQEKLYAQLHKKLDEEKEKIRIVHEFIDNNHEAERIANEKQCDAKEITQKEFFNKEKQRIEWWNKFNALKLDEKIAYIQSQQTS